MTIAESLRRLHDAGSPHGALSPESIALTATGVELLPAQRSDEITPYTAPEVIAGRPADIAADVFAYGAILYEMLSGRRAFEGITSATLTAAIQSSQPASLGSPVVDRLIGSCLAKEPAARCQRMQKILMELKLYSVAVRKAETASAPRHSVETATQMQQLEARLVARLQAHESRVVEVEQAAGKALEAVRLQIAAANAELAAAKDRSGKLEVEIQAFGERIVARVHQSVEGIAGRIAAMDQSLVGVAARIAQVEQDIAQAGASAPKFEEAIAERIAALDQSLAGVAERMGRAEQDVAQIGASAPKFEEAIAERIAALDQSLAGVAGRMGRVEQDVAQISASVGRYDEAIAVSGERMTRLEDGILAVQKHASELHDAIAEDMQSFETVLKQQATSIESARTAMAQTDDLVERVVEALESLQSTVLEQSEDRALAVN